MLVKLSSPSAGRSLSRDQVLDAGLALLEAVGAQGFGLRPLARQLGITPMSVIHHVGDQQELMRSLVERVHGQPLIGSVRIQQGPEAADGLVDPGRDLFFARKPGRGSRELAGPC